jgi:multiple sugar transport system permease protein
VLAIVVLIVAPVVTNFVLSLYDYFVGGRPRTSSASRTTSAPSADARVWNGVKQHLLFHLHGRAAAAAAGHRHRGAVQPRLPRQGLARTVILLPMVATPVAIALIWALMFNPSLGVLNYFLESLGLERSLWVAQSNLAIPSLVLVDTWQWSPMIALILLAAMQSVPAEHYEAARIDGASGWQSFWHITIPSIRSAIVVALILRAVDALKTFDIIYVITEGGPGTASETLNVLAFKTGFQFFHAGYAATLLIFLMFLVLGIAMLLNADPEARMRALATRPAAREAAARPRRAAPQAGKTSASTC